MRSFFIYCLLVFTCMSCTQQGKKKAPYRSLIDTAVMHRHLLVLADTAMQGRETATAGEEKAATYIKNEFSKLGLWSPGGNALIPFNVYRDSLLKVSLTIDQTVYQRYRDFDLYLNYGHRHNISSYSTLYAGYGIDAPGMNDYRDVDAENYIVVVDDGEPMLNDSVYKLSGTAEKSRWASVREKLKNAMKHKAAALFIIKEIEKPQEEQNLGRMYVDPDRDEMPIPVYFISPRLKQKILSYNVKPGNLKNTEANNDRIRLSDSCLTTTRQSRNILGLLPGESKKDEYVFITAHYDHLGKKGSDVYCGADDNASGTAAVLTIAEAFVKAKKAGHGPRRNVVFMLVSGEEKGLLGSKYYTANPVFPLDKTSLDLNIDMIGRVGGDYVSAKDSLNYIYLIGDDKLSTELASLCTKSNKKTGLVLDRKYNDPADPNRFYFRSDHYNFAKKGVPIVFYFDGVHKDYHKPGDTADKINMALMGKRAQLILNTAMKAASMKRMIKRNIPLEE